MPRATRATLTAQRYARTTPEGAHCVSEPHLTLILFSSLTETNHCRKPSVCNLQINKITHSPEHLSYRHPIHFTLLSLLGNQYGRKVEKRVHPSLCKANVEFGRIFRAVHTSGPAPKYLAVGDKSYLPTFLSSFGDFSPLLSGAQIGHFTSNPANSTLPSPPGWIQIRQAGADWGYEFTYSLSQP